MELEVIIKFYVPFTGRCYEAEIRTVVLPLRYDFAWYPFFPISKFSVSGRKPWTTVSPRK